jgi:hypothetical protein
MGMIGDLEAKGLPGEMVLRYVEDPRLYRLYVKKKKEREQAEQQMLKQQQDMEVDQSVRQIGGDLLKATIGGGDNAVQK